MCRLTKYYTKLATYQASQPPHLFLTMHYWSFFFCITMYNHVIHVTTGLSIYQKSLEERRLLQWELSRGAETSVKLLDCCDEQK